MTINPTSPQPKHAHPNGGSCWTPSRCAALNAVAELRTLAVRQDDHELSVRLDMIEATLKGEEIPGGLRERLAEILHGPESHPVSIHTPTAEDLTFTRDILSRSDAEFLPHYLIGVIRSLVGMGDNPRERSAEEMVRLVRAAIVAYDERRDQ